MILKQIIRYENAAAIEATWADENDRQVYCRAYSGDQMDELRADLGADAAAYEDMIQQCEADYAPPAPPPEPTKFEKDQARYTKRAAVKDQLIAYMAADNMGRVRSGEWTVEQLTSLMGDPEVAAANAYMGTLSFELAAQAILAATSTLLTPAIRAAWVGKLQEHFYLEA